MVPFCSLPKRTCSWEHDGSGHSKFSPFMTALFWTLTGPYLGAIEKTDGEL